MQANNGLCLPITYVYKNEKYYSLANTLHLNLFHSSILATNMQISPKKSKQLSLLCILLLIINLTFLHHQNNTAHDTNVHIQDIKHKFIILIFSIQKTNKKFIIIIFVSNYC